MNRRVFGFTLIELLVALFVFTLLTVMSYQGLNAMAQTRARLDQETRKWQALERFFAKLDGELAQVLPYTVRMANGWEAPPLAGSDSSTASFEDVQLAFTRNVGHDAEELPIAPQRVGYRLRQGNLEILRWNAPDSAQYTTPEVEVILGGVREFNLRFLDNGRSWKEAWPKATSDEVLPRGIEIELVLDTGEKLTRFFSLR